MKAALAKLKSLEKELKEIDLTKWKQVVIWGNKALPMILKHCSDHADEFKNLLKEPTYPAGIRVFPSRPEENSPRYIFDSERYTTDLENWIQSQQRHEQQTKNELAAHRQNCESAYESILAFLDGIIHEMSSSTALSNQSNTISDNEGIQQDNRTSEVSPVDSKPKVFVVHGRNNELKQTVARFLERLDINVILLHEQASTGRTVIEKFEEHADVRFAVILLTADDQGCLAPATTLDSLRYRARQNVVFEWGYFTARLGRANVCAIAAQNVEIPSEMHGVLNLAADETNDWKLQLSLELNAAGMKVDLNKAFM